MPEIKNRTCPRCGVEYPEAVFFLIHSLDMRMNPKTYHKVLCRACRQQERDSTKHDLAGRAEQKAKHAIATHSKRLAKKGITYRDLVGAFGWNRKQMAHDILHAYENGCPYCRKSFRSMAHGLADVTLDIVDPSLPPYYRTNTRWVCATCNHEKSDMNPQLWNQYLQCWAKWEERQRELQNDQFAGLPLLQGHTKQTLFNVDDYDDR